MQRSKVGTLPMGILPSTDWNVTDSGPKNTGNWWWIDQSQPGQCFSHIEICSWKARMLAVRILGNQWRPFSTFQHRWRQTRNWQTNAQQVFELHASSSARHLFFRGEAAQATPRPDTSWSLNPKLFVGGLPQPTWTYPPIVGYGLKTFSALLFTHQNRRIEKNRFVHPYDNHHFTSSLFLSIPISRILWSQVLPRNSCRSSFA